MLLKSAFVLIALSLLGFGFPARAQPSPTSVPSSVPVPCGPAGTGLRLCSLVLNGGGYTNGSTTTAESGAQTVPGIIPLLKSRIQKQIDCQAQGIDLSSTLATPSQLAANPPPSCVGTNFGPHVCNPVANDFDNNTAELTTNHEGASCGSPATVNVTDTILYGPFGIPTGVNVFANVTGSVQSQEYAYANGALPQAEACYYAEVVQELNNGAVNTTGATDICAALASNLIAVNSSYNAQLKAALTTLSGQASDIGLKASLATQANIADITACQNSGQINAASASFTTYTNMSGQRVTSPNTDPENLRQSAQNICALRASVESAFAQFAACEVFVRASNSWATNFGNPGAVQANLINPMIDPNDPKSVNSICSKQCASGQSAPNPTPSSSAEAAAVEAQANTALTAAQSCAQACYNANVGPFIQNIIQTYYPNTGGCR